MGNFVNIFSVFRIFDGKKPIFKLISAKTQIFETLGKYADLTL